MTRHETLLLLQELVDTASIGLGNTGDCGSWPEDRVVDHERLMDNIAELLEKENDGASTTLGQT